MRSTWKSKYLIKSRRVSQTADAPREINITTLEKMPKRLFPAAMPLLNSREMINPLPVKEAIARRTEKILTENNPCLRISPKSVRRIRVLLFGLAAVFLSAAF